MSLLRDFIIRLTCKECHQKALRNGNYVLAPDYVFRTNYDLSNIINNTMKCSGVNFLVLGDEGNFQ